MQWRRGIVFAAVQLAASLAIIVSIEADESAMWRDHHSPSGPPAETVKKESAPPTKATAGESVEVDLNLCGLLDEYPPREEIVMFANMPAAIVAEWRNPCPPRWSIAGMLRGTAWEMQTPALLDTYRIEDRILLILIGVQWLLIGSFPLRHSHNSWRDPAMIIMISSVAAAALSIVPNVESFCTIPLFFIMFAWLWWLAQLARKLLQSALNWIKGRRLAHSE